MTREQFEALVWEQIDGRLGERDRRRMTAYVASHPEAREWQRQIESTARHLAEVREVPPPAALRARIDASLATATPPEIRLSMFARLRRLFVPNFPGWSAVLRAESSSLRNVDRSGLWRYQAMSARRNTVIVGFAVVVIVAIAVIGYYSLHRPPAPPENAVGATGVAQRYKAEQIKDQDVRLDLKGEQALDEAVFAAMTEEQKAALLDRMGEAGRQTVFEVLAVRSDSFQRMPQADQVALWNMVAQSERQRVRNDMKIQDTDAQRWTAEMRVNAWKSVQLAERFRALQGMKVAERQVMLAKLQLNEMTFQGLDRAKKAERWDQLGEAGRYVVSMRYQELAQATVRNMDERTASDMWERMTDAERTRSLDEMKVADTDYQRWTQAQRAQEWQRVPEHERNIAYARSASLPCDALRTMSEAQRATALMRINANERAAVLRTAGLNEARVNQMSVQERATELNRIVEARTVAQERATQERMIQERTAQERAVQERAVEGRATTK